MPLRCTHYHTEDRMPSRAFRLQTDNSNAAANQFWNFRECPRHPQPTVLIWGKIKRGKMGDTWSPCQCQLLNCLSNNWLMTPINSFQHNNTATHHCSSFPESLICWYPESLISQTERIEIVVRNGGTHTGIWGMGEGHTEFLPWRKGKWARSQSQWWGRENGNPGIGVWGAHKIHDGGELGESCREC